MAGRWTSLPRGMPASSGSLPRRRKVPASRTRPTARARPRRVNAGLLWGAYHFGTGADVDSQLSNFLGKTGIDDAMLYALDFEANPGNTMSLAQAKDFIQKLDTRLGRKAVIYGGDLLKTALGGTQRCVPRPAPPLVGAIQRHSAYSADVEPVLALAIHRRPPRSAAACGERYWSLRHRQFRGHGSAVASAMGSVVRPD